MNWYDAPYASDSDVNVTTDPGSDAIWCGALSWFIQVTVLPVFIVRVAGLKAKFLIVIVFDPPEEAGVIGVEVCGPGADVQPENEHARTIRIRHADQKARREYEDIVSLKAVVDKKCSCRIQKMR